MVPKSTEHIVETLTHAIATGLYTGYLPLVPGTWGTLLIGIPLYLAVHRLGTVLYVAFLAVLSLVSIYTAERLELRTAQRDPHCVVIDEVVGYLFATAFLPCSLTNIIFSFFLFRGFDTIKPYPVGLADRKVRGGLGITLDDILAGILANISLRIIHWGL